LSGDAWVSYELASRDVAAICVSLSIEAQLANLTSVAAAVATALIAGLQDITDDLQEHRALAEQLQTAMVGSMETQREHFALSQAALALAALHENAIDAVASSLDEATTLSSAALASARSLAAGLGWLVELRVIAETAATWLGLLWVARAAWRCVRERKRLHDAETNVERRLRTAVRTAVRIELAARDAELMALVGECLAAMEARLLAAIGEDDTRNHVPPASDTARTAASKERSTRRTTRAHRPAAVT
jgi:hypothetical protein